MKLAIPTGNDAKTGKAWGDRLADPNEVDRAERNAAGWRAGFFVLGALFVIAMIGNAILAGTMRTRAIVYFATPDEIKYVGDTAQVFTPTLLQTEYQIGTFISTLRHVPHGDPTLADQDALTLEAMLNANGYQEWTSGLALENPKILSQKGYGRDVVGVPTVEQKDKLSYFVTWTERVYQPGQNTAPVNINCSGVVTLAADPTPPTSVEVASRNPVGISVTSYDLKAPNLGATP